MFKKIGFIFFLTLIFLTPQKVYAALYINEISSTSDPDWVEIYNSDSSSSVDLSNYQLRDSTDTNKLDLTGTIAANGFITFDWSNRLNSDGDTIKLVSKSDGSVVNQVVYGVPGDVPAPQGTQTAGRNPDGTSNWVLLATASKGSSNNSSEIVPTPTPSPTPAPTSTPTPTPTKSPTSTPTPTPTKSPAPNTSSITPPITSSSNSNQAQNQSANPNSQNSNSNLNLSGGSDTLFTSPTPDVTPEVLGASTSSGISPFIFIVLGLIFMLVCAILAYFQFGDKLFIWKHKDL